jgi:hypothetical protein
MTAALLVVTVLAFAGIGVSIFAWKQIVGLFFSVEVPLIVLIWVLPLIWRAAPFDKRETEACYTTLKRSHPELPQLDPQTGSLVRLGGAPYVSARRRNRTGFAGELAPSDVPSSDRNLPRPSLLRRARGTLIQAAVSAVIVFVLVWWRENFTLQAEKFALFALVGLLVIFLAVYAIGAMVARVRLRALTSVAPNEFAFRFRQNREKKDALAVSMLTAVDRPFPRGPWGATADNSGLKLWRGKSPELATTIPWSRVTSIQRDSVSVGRTSFPTVLIGLTTVDDTVTSLQLVWPNADAVPLQSTVEADWIVAQLNRLRASRSAATIL